MNKTVATFYARARARIAKLEPELRKAILRTFENIRTGLPEGMLVRMIKAGDLEALLDEAITDRAVLPMRMQLRTILQKSFELARRDMPKGGVLGGLPAIAFDHLSPDVVEAIRTLETRALDTLRSDVRSALREAVRRGLEEGRAVGAIAREMRGMIGLAPNQLDAVSNFRAMLEAGDREALTRVLRDRRFDPLLERTLGVEGEGLTGAQIDRMTAAYTNRFVAWNASVNARAATVDAYKQGQFLSWQRAETEGVIPEGFVLMKEWVGVGDEREREAHLIMNGETVPADAPYSNGQMVAGEGDFNCRCVDRYYLAREEG